MKELRGTDAAHVAPLGSFDDPEAYIARDRRVALAQGVELPDRVFGAALFADISGFTPLTEALAAELGPERGAEELTGLREVTCDGVRGGLEPDLPQSGDDVVGRRLFGHGQGGCIRHRMAADLFGTTLAPRNPRGQGDGPAAGPEPPHASHRRREPVAGSGHSR